MSSTSLDPRRIPIIGNDIYQVGQVLSIAGQPCAPKPTIAVSAFFTYTPYLIWSLVKPEPIDFVTERFGRPHKRRRRARLNIDDLDALSGPGSPGFKNLVYSSFKFAERVGWYFLVADATSDFLINWTSVAYQWSGCFTPDPIIAQTTGVDTFMARTVGPSTHPMPTQEHFASPDAFAGQGTVGIFGAGPKYVTFQASPRSVPNAFGTGQITRVYAIPQIAGGEPRIIEGAPDDPEDPNSKWSGTSSLFLETTGGQIWDLRVEATGGDLWSGEVEFTAHGGPPTGITFDP